MIIDRFDNIELKLEDVKHRIMVIKINQLYKENISKEDLYDAVRGVWRASIKRAQTIEYVFGVYHSMIVAIYKPTQWYICKNAVDMIPRGEALTPRIENRIFFIDKSYESGAPYDANQEFYIGKSIANLEKIAKAQNPVTYLTPINIMD